MTAIGKGYHGENRFYISLFKKDAEPLYIRYGPPSPNFIDAIHFETIKDARRYAKIQMQYNWSKGYNLVIGSLFLEINGYDLGEIVEWEA